MRKQLRLRRMMQLWRPYFTFTTLLLYSFVIACKALNGKAFIWRFAAANCFFTIFVLLINVAQDFGGQKPPPKRPRNPFMICRLVRGCRGSCTITSLVSILTNRRRMPSRRYGGRTPSHLCTGMSAVEKGQGHGGAPVEAGIGLTPRRGRGRRLHWSCIGAHFAVPGGFSLNSLLAFSWRQKFDLANCRSPTWFWC